MALIRRWFRLVLGCALLIATYFLFPVTAEERLGSTALRYAGIVVTVGLMALFLTLQMRRQVEREDSVRIDGLILSMVAVIVGFAFLYYGLGAHDPTEVAGLETKVDALYFTLTTTTTVGYGDIHATGQFARTLVMLQMLFSLVLLTAAASLLSSRWRSSAVERAQQRHSERVQKEHAREGSGQEQDGPPAPRADPT